MREARNLTVLQKQDVGAASPGSWACSCCSKNSFVARGVGKNSWWLRSWKYQWKMINLKDFTHHTLFLVPEGWPFTRYTFQNNNFSDILKKKSNCEIFYSNKNYTIYFKKTSKLYLWFCVLFGFSNHICRWRL